MQWDETAEGVLATLCRMVPETIRELAQAAAHDESEVVASERGGASVTVDDVIRGWIRTTPPSTERTAPFTNAASSEARYRYAYATSFGSPRRRTGVRSTIVARIFSGICRTISVPMNPGATAFTVIPRGPSSRAQT